MEDSGDGFGSQFMTPITGADSAVVPPPGMPPVDAPPPQNGGFGDAVGSAVSNFGNGLKSLLGPQYAPAPPDASPLDRAANQLQQQSKRAEAISTNPIAQFFAPEKVQEARQFLPKAAEELQKIEQQRQHAADVKATARNWGLDNPNQFGPGATDTTLANEALRQWKDGGNFNAYKALSGLSGEWKARADLYMPEAMGVFAKHVAGVQDGIARLNNAASMGDTAYKAARDAIINDKDFSSLGVRPGDVPATSKEWAQKSGALMTQYNTAQRTLSAFQAQQDRLHQASPVTEDKVAKQIEGTYQFGNGETIPGFKAVSLPGYGDVQGVMGPPKSKDRDTFGDKWSLASPEQVKTTTEQLKAEEVKGALSKYKMARDFSRTAQNDKLYTSAAGLALISDELGAIGRDVAEGSKAAGSIGLTRMLEDKYGTVDKGRNALNREISALKEWMGRPPSDRLGMPSIEGIKEVARFKAAQATQEVSERIGQPLETAGRYGIGINKLGLDKELIDDPALRRTYDDALARSKAELKSYAMVPIGDRAVLLPPGSSVKGAMPPQQPTTTQLPGATPLQTPVQQATNPQPPGSPSAPQAPQMPGASPQAGAPGGNPPAPVPTGGPTPGRTGVPPNMPLNSPEALTAAANRTIQIESGFKPGSKTGSYVGLGQWSKEEMQRHGITDPDDVEQTRAALQKDIVRRAAKLQKDGLSATPSNVYLMHQQGEAGLEAHLRNPDGPAWENIRFGFKNDAIAKRAIWGNMTDDMKRSMGLRSIDDVGKVTSGDFTRLWEARFAGTDTKPGSAGARMMAGAPAEPAIGANDRTAPRHVAGTRRDVADPGTTWDDVRKGAIEHAPAIGSTLGAGIGTLGGPAGTIAGGAVGGGGGQSLKDYLLGNKQDPVKIAKEGAIGGILGVVPGGSAAARAAGAGIRTVGVGAIEAGAKAAEGGDLVDSAEAGLTGARDAALGEGFGRALGAAGHKIWSWFTPDAKKAVRAAAADLHEANETLKTEQPKLPGAAGAAATANPKYEAAQAAKENAEEKIKEMLPNAKPDEVAYAHKVHAEGVPNQEAAAARPGTIEKAKIGAGYQQLESEMGRARDFRNPDRAMKDAGVRPDGKPMLEDGPMAAVAAKKVSAAHAELAERTEMVITAPAKNWQEKWTQLKDVRSALLDAERDATTSTAAGRTQTAKDMRTLADTVREQQVKAAEAVLGEKGGAEVIKRLGLLDTRYARLMKATNDGDIAVAARLKGEKGREADRAFRAFAQDDHVALAAWNAMRSAGPDVERDIRTLVGVEKIRVLGHLVSAVKLAAGYNQWRADRAAGSHARFADFVPELKEAAVRERRTVRNIAGSIGARAAVN